MCKNQPRYRQPRLKLFITVAIIVARCFFASINGELVLRFGEVSRNRQTVWLNSQNRNVLSERWTWVDAISDTQRQPPFTYLNLTINYACQFAVLRICSLYTCKVIAERCPNRKCNQEETQPRDVHFSRTINMTRILGWKVRDVNRVAS